MKKISKFLDKLSAHPEQKNICVIIMFSIFIAAEIATGDTLFIILDMLILISESLELRRNLKAKKNIKE